MYIYPEVNHTVTVDKPLVHPRSAGDKLSAKCSLKALNRVPSVTQQTTALTERHIIRIRSLEALGWQAQRELF